LNTATRKYLFQVSELWKTLHHESTHILLQVSKFWNMLKTSYHVEVLSFHLFLWSQVSCFSKASTSWKVYTFYWLRSSHRVSEYFQPSTAPPPSSEDAKNCSLSKSCTLQTFKTNSRILIHY